MPCHTEKEIKAKIADGTIFAISVDTSVFDKYGCNLDFAVIRKLDQFRVGDFRVLLSAIVDGEVRSHIKRDAAETQRALKKAARTHASRWKLIEADATLPGGLQVDADAPEQSDKQVDEFITAVGAEIVPTNQLDNITEEVMRRYFAPELPFEAGEKKKHEFPDAFALLSLEHRARQHTKLLLCVTQDKGWQKFAAGSEWLVAINDLERALSLFNEAGRPVAEKATALLRAGQLAIDEIDTAVQARLDDNDFEVDAWSYMDFDVDDQFASLQEVDLESISAPIVIAADDDEVAFTVRLTARVSFEASFSYFVRDSVDRDMVSLGSETEQVERDIDLEVAITVSRDENEPEVLDAEAPKQRIRANFGDLEPFKDEDPTFEKY